MSTKEKERAPEKLPNYYLALDILPGASHNEILHAYNRSKMTYSNGSLAAYGLIEGDSNKSILDEIEQAFAVLGNPGRRREYDLKMGYHTWTEEDEAAKASAGDDMGPGMVTTLKHASSSPRKEESSRPAPAEMPAPAAKVTSFVPRRASANSASTSAPLAPDFEANSEFEKQIEECKAVDGAFLKAVRIYRRMTTDQLAQRCKLSASHIETIENEDGASLHQPVYLRGHVYLMSQALGLPDPGMLAVTFLNRMRELGKLPKTPF